MKICCLQTERWSMWLREISLDYKSSSHQLKVVPSSATHNTCGINNRYSTACLCLMDSLTLRAETLGTWEFTAMLYITYYLSQSCLLHLHHVHVLAPQLWKATTCDSPMEGVKNHYSALHTGRQLYSGGGEGGGRLGGRDGRREGGREGRKEGGKEGGKEGRKEGGWSKDEGGRYAHTGQAMT